jgi:hypothetical protein
MFATQDGTPGKLAIYFMNVDIAANGGSNRSTKFKSAVNAVNAFGGELMVPISARVLYRQPELVVYP